MRIEIPGAFDEDWLPGDEDEYQDLARAINQGQRKKRGRGYVIEVELTNNQIKVLKEEAKYRMEFHSRIYQDEGEPIDWKRHYAAKRLYQSIADA